MADYVLLYTGGGMPETEEEQAAQMQAWTSWFENLGPALKDGGNPFSGQAKSISSDGSISDGATAPATGYSIIEADSLDAATDLAKSCPVLQGGASVSVFETFKVM
jgi:hypothetical protein